MINGVMMVINGDSWWLRDVKSDCDGDFAAGEW